jgi:hypothetical protein
MEPTESDAHASERTRLDCTVEIEFADRVSFAMHQNGVPLVESVRVVSRHAEALEDVLLELSLANGEAEPWSARLERLAAGGTATFEPKDFVLASQMLASRTEAERSEVRCRVECGEASCERSFALELLAFDQWPGIGYFPDLTAAFVTPNHPDVATLLGAARQAIGASSGSDALDGYQSGSRQRAAQLAEACFAACAARSIGYINPPASFEVEGQRVRLVDRLLREQLGTCLDLSLLLASSARSNAGCTRSCCSPRATRWPLSGRTTHICRRPRSMSPPACGT